MAHMIVAVAVVRCVACGVKVQWEGNVSLRLDPTSIEKLKPLQMNNLLRGELVEVGKNERRTHQHWRESPNLQTFDCLTMSLTPLTVPA